MEYCLINLFGKVCFKEDWKCIIMEQSNVGVSVICLTYNHEKYIRQALEGFISQKTTFPYEVIVHDDASTDNTQSIILEYAKKYPDIIKPILQKENQYSQKKSIHKFFTAPAAHGKYIAYCEGDDFWTDYNKLQRQYEILETHSDCSMCVHKVQKINEDGSIHPHSCPNFDMDEQKIDVEGFLKIQPQYPFQTTSYFMKSELWKDLVFNPPKFRQVSSVGDEPMLLFMVTHGNIYYLKECMSCYRMFSIGSYSYRLKRSEKNKIRATECMYNMMIEFDKYTNNSYDCNLTLYRGRMLLYQEKYKELLKKENKDYLKKLRFYKRAYIYLCATFPFLGKLKK